MLVLHFDYTSLPSAIAVMRLHRFRREGGAVSFSGIDALGVEVAVPVTLDQLADIAELRDRARDVGLAIRQPSRHPPSLGAHLIGELAESAGVGLAWREAVLRAYWCRDVAIDERQALAELAAGVAMDAAQVERLLDDQSARMALRRRMTTDRSRGVGGVPMLEFDGSLLPSDLSDADLKSLAGL